MLAPICNRCHRDKAESSPAGKKARIANPRQRDPHQWIYRDELSEAKSAPAGASGENAGADL